jgi:hypothetical protein
MVSATSLPTLWSSKRLWRKRCKQAETQNASTVKKVVITEIFGSSICHEYSYAWSLFLQPHLERFAKSFFLWVCSLRGSTAPNQSLLIGSWQNCWRGYRSVYRILFARICRAESNAFHEYNPLYSICNVGPYLLCTHQASSQVTAYAVFSTKIPQISANTIWNSPQLSTGNFFLHWPIKTKPFQFAVGRSVYLYLTATALRTYVRRAGDFRSLRQRLTVEAQTSFVLEL